MIERVATLAELLKKGMKREYLPYLAVLVILVLVGAVLALGASYPILSPFLYSLF